MFACALLSLYMLIVIDIFSFSLDRTGWRRFASTFLLFYGQIILTEFALGLCSLLYGWILILLNAGITTGTAYWLYRKHGKALFNRYDANLRKSVANGIRRALKDPFWFAILVLTLICVLWIIFLGIIFPATDFDGNSYHLTYVGYLIQNHNIFDASTSLGWLTGYPKGGEFIEAWSVIIAHKDTFADLSQIPFLLLGVYALYEAAVTLGSDKRHARFAALLYAFVPVVLNQLKTTYVDVMLCSLFIAGLAMIIRRKLSKLDLVLIGIIFSLVLSIKSSGLLFIIVFMPLLIWNLYQDRGRAIKKYMQPALLIVGPMTFGLYWYIKNLILYHSPLYPFGYKVGNTTIFPGIDLKKFIDGALTTLTSLPHGSLQRIWFVWTEQKDWFGCMYNYDTDYAGLGPVWFIVLIPAVIISIYFAVKKRNHLLLAVMATVIGLFIVYPTDYYSRYTMFIVSIGVIALGFALSNIGKVTARVIKLLALLLALYVIGTNYTLCNFAPVVVADQLKSILHGSERGIIYQNIPGQAFVVLEERIKPGQTVIYDSSPYFIYPLWTPNFSDKVLYLPDKTATAWYQNIAKKHVSYIFTTINSRENKWAEGHYKAIYKDAMYEIFQVN